MTFNSKLHSHFSRFYDEKQLINRSKIYFETLLLTFFLIFITCMIKIFYGPFAEPNVEMAILFSLPVKYFLIRSIMKEICFTKNEKYRVAVITFFAFIGIVFIISSAAYLINGGPVIENGVIVWKMANIFIALPFLSVPIAYRIQKMKQKDVNEDEE